MPPSPDRRLWELCAAHDLAGLRVDVSLLRLGLALEYRYRPDQPRVPAGQEGGGRWSGGSGGGRVHVTLPNADEGRVRLSQAVDRDGYAIASAVNEGDRDTPFDGRHVVTAPDSTRTVFETSGATQTIRDGETGEILSRATWGPNGLEPDAVRQDALFRPRVPGTPPIPPPGQTVGAGLALYNALAERTRSTANVLALGFRAGLFLPAGSGGQLDWSGFVSRGDTEAACPRLPEVQTLTDEAYAHANDRGGWASPASLGTFVHTQIKKKVEGLEDSKFQAEVSYLKSQAASVTYGTAGSVRVDVFEQTPDDTICVYDIKTGRSGLSVARMQEIVRNAQTAFKTVPKVVVIEIRPTGYTGIAP